MSDTPDVNVRLYPVTLDLSCEQHGVVQRVTVISLAAQQQWTQFFTERHKDSDGCEKELQPLVVTR